MFRLLLAGLLVLSATGQAAERQHPDRPLLWEVKGKGLEKPSYLFGTIHVGAGPVSQLHPAAKQAFDKAEIVYTEIPMDDATQLGLTAGLIRKDGKTLKDSIGEGLTERLNTELKAINPGLDSTPLQSMKTWTVAVSLPMLEFQFAGVKPLDVLIWDRAVEAGKKTAALEKPSDQFSIFDELSEEEQVIYLAETLRSQKKAREEKRNPSQELIDAYLRGEPEGIEAELDKFLVEMAEGDHRDLGEALLKRLLDDRNVTMSETIEARLTAEPDKSHFFAVGVGHYVGKKSIGDLLTRKGYHVTRIDP